MAKKSKFQKVVDHLESGRPLTKLDCLRLYGYWNLSDLVYKLKKRHSPDYITTVMKKNLSGEYAEYVLTHQNHLKKICINCANLDKDKKCFMDGAKIKDPSSNNCILFFQLKTQ